MQVGERGGGGDRGEQCGPGTKIYHQCLPPAEEKMLQSRVRYKAVRVSWSELFVKKPLALALEEHSTSMGHLNLNEPQPHSTSMGSTRYTE